jgi:hypothetical protein
MTRDNVITSFYGVTCVQTFTYYQLFDRDRLTLKLSVSNRPSYPWKYLNVVLRHRCFSFGRFVAISSAPLLSLGYAGYSTHSKWRWYHTRFISTRFQTGAILWISVSHFGMQASHVNIRFLNWLDCGPCRTFWVSMCLMSPFVDIDADPQQAQVLITVRCFLPQYHTICWISWHSIRQLATLLLDGKPLSTHLLGLSVLIIVAFMERGFGYVSQLADCERYR